MSDARFEVLQRVRQALVGRGVDRAQDYDAIKREYRQTGVLAVGERLRLFSSRLADYGVVVHRAAPGPLSLAIARALEARGKTRLVVPDGLVGDQLPAGIEWVRDEALTYRQLDGVDGVVTGCTVAIALTGTIVLCHSAREGRRAITLVPDYHLCLVDAEQVVETVPEAMKWLDRMRPSLVTTISGPSATADIEMTRVKGVHGPRTVDVVLMETAESDRP